MIPTGWQIRDGRELTDLAEAIRVGAAKVTAHMPMLTRRDAAAIQKGLEAAEVEFVQGDGGVGAQLRKVDQGSEPSWR